MAQLLIVQDDSKRAECIASLLLQTCLTSSLTCEMTNDGVHQLLLIDKALVSKNHLTELLEHIVADIQTLLLHWDRIRSKSSHNHWVENFYEWNRGFVRAFLDDGHESQ